MSHKSKNLEFTASQPAFLQRLRGQITGSLPADQDPDRHIDKVNFGKRKHRLGEEDGEDEGPTYVLESGESVSQKEYESMVAKGEDPEDKETANDGDLEKKEAKDEKTSDEKKESVKIGGMSKKRRIVKIGDEKLDDGKVEEDTPSKSASEKTKEAPKVKKGKKKGKVMLSFGDDER
jgi:hypothetical protein